MREGAGKAGCQPHPMASYVKGSETYELQSPRDWPDIRLSLHEGHYGLCRICPGVLHSTRRHATVLRLAIRLDGFAFARLDATGASITWFCRTPLASVVVLT
jgi:hypothetical protein